MAAAPGGSSSWNRNNPAIRRILADVRELQIEPSDQYAARPVEDNMFDWHFSIRGPAGTDFEGGLYHGRIVLPPDYPFKPPSIMLLTPNGRWEVNKKICLSISAYHPEQWQPAWGIRTILEALISFMTTPGDGALGALDFSPLERKRLARESARYQHPLMPEVPALGTARPSSRDKYRSEIAKMHVVSLEPPTDSAPATDAPAAPVSAGPAPGLPGPEQGSVSTAAPSPAPALAPAPEPAHAHAHAPAPAPIPVPAAQTSTPVPGRAPAPAPAQAPAPAPELAPAEAPAAAREAELRRRAPAAAAAPTVETPPQQGQPGVAPAATPAQQQGAVATRRAAAPVRRRPDYLLYYAIALGLVIFAIIYRKAVRKFRQEL
jgi:ubiquitin-conjugating enzyme E2 J1